MEPKGMDLGVLVVGVCAQYHSGVKHLLGTCVCKLCLDKVGMWLEKFQNFEL